MAATGRQVLEFAHDPLVNGALERYDEVRDVLHRLPAPRRELLFLRAIGMLDIDFAFGAGEAHRKPFLRLTAVFAFPGLADDLARNVVAEPIRDLGNAFHRADVGFFAQLAQSGRPWLFAGIDAALRHLPSVREIDVLGPADAAADEGAAVAIEHHQADAGAEGKIFEAHIGDRCSAVSNRTIEDI